LAKAEQAHASTYRLIVVGGHTRSIGKTQLVCELVAALPEANFIAGKITQYGHGVCAQNGEHCGCAPDEHASAFSWEESAISGTDSAAKPAKKRGARKDRVFCGYGWDLRARASQKRERGRTRSRCTSRGATKKTTSRFDEETTIWLDSSRPES